MFLRIALKFHTSHGHFWYSPDIVRSFFLVICFEMIDLVMIRTCFEMIDLKFYRRLSDCFSWILKEQWGSIVTEKYEKNSQ